MILEVQIQTFSAPAHGSQSFWLLNILGGPNINIFLWNFAWSFLLHFRTNKEQQIQNLSFKNYYFGPPKKQVFGFWRKTQNKILSSCFGSDSALKH